MSDLPRLQLELWELTKETLHLCAQIVGKVRLASTPPQNHWWNAPLLRRYTKADHAPASLRALRLRRLLRLAHELVVRTSRGEVDSVPLADGLSVAAFYERLFALLAPLGIEAEIKAVAIRGSDDNALCRRHRARLVRSRRGRALWQALRWIDRTFQEFAGWFCGKTSPVHLFWHGFDLAVTRFSGARGPENPDADSVTREAYSHEVISFGFWPGDHKVRMPAWKCGRRPPRGRPCSTSWRAPTRPAPRSPAGIATRCARPGARRRP